MAVQSFGSTKINPQGTFDVQRTTAGTLTNSNVVQVMYDDALFTQAEGRTRLILALEHILNAVREHKVHTWPTA